MAEITAKVLTYAIMTVWTIFLAWVLFGLWWVALPVVTTLIVGYERRERDAPHRLHRRREPGRGG